MYQIKIDKDALNDLSQIVKWYNDQSVKLGTRFHKQVKSQINSLKTYPFICNIRYKNVRCMLVKKFPFMIHYTISEELNIIEIFSIFHTSRNPEIWNFRLNK